jgi:diadenosine tetraphosphate (Ap4A) HIT family hydrolase
VKKAADDSYWIVVPQEPAVFGHLLVISWEDLGEQDITDEGLFTDLMHMQSIIRMIHEVTLKMKNHLTSDGTASGRKCEKVYLISECESPDLPFHFHLIPRFQNDRKGHFYLFEKELEEARWMVGKEGEGEKLADGCCRIANTEALSLFHRYLILSKKWTRDDNERKNSIERIKGWTKLHLEN